MDLIGGEEGYRLLGPRTMDARPINLHDLGPVAADEAMLASAWPRGDERTFGARDRRG